MTVDRTKLNRGARLTKTVRLTENEIKAIGLYQKAMWVEQNRDLTFPAALRDILHSFNWPQLDDIDLGETVV